MYELKIYGGVICHGNEEQCKIWRGIDVLVQNWPEDFDKFSPKHSRKPYFNELLLTKVYNV